MTTSLHLAQAFQKRHDNVLNIVRQREQKWNEQSTMSKDTLEFKETSWTDAQNRQQPLYYLTKKACMFVLMKFEGKEAVAQQGTPERGGGADLRSKKKRPENQSLACEAS